MNKYVYDFIRNERSVMRNAGIRKMYYPLTLILDKNKSLQWNEDKILELNNQIYKDNETRDKILRECEERITNLIVSQIQNEGFTHEQAKVIFDYAYENTHSSGYESVYEESMSLCDFAKKLKEVQ